MRVVRSFFILIVLSGLLLSGCEHKQKAESSSAQNATTLQAKITFIELGSNNCIPCRKMQPVMKVIERKYAAQVNVIFYDVWTKEQRHYAYDYGIRIIPTQIFLDARGKEIMRHEGFFPQKDIERFLTAHGITADKKEGAG